MSRISPENLDKAFDLLVDHAVKGLRCPVTSGPGKHPKLASVHISTLAKAGRVFVEISTSNFRRVTILTGPHKGKATAANPDPRARVYLTASKEGTRINGRFTDARASARKQPSAPRLLTSAEIFK